MLERVKWHAGTGRPDPSCHPSVESLVKGLPPKVQPCLEFKMPHQLAVSRDPFHFYFRSNLQCSILFYVVLYYIMYFIFIFIITLSQFPFSAFLFFCFPLVSGPIPRLRGRPPLLIIIQISYLIHKPCLFFFFLFFVLLRC